MTLSAFVVFFFFQAEDGIRDYKVTGVQTCALPIIRESVTISRGTTGGGGLTRIGSHNLLMAYVHIGHDSLVGSHCILANCATLAGHVMIEDYASVGAF